MTSTRTWFYVFAVLGLASGSLAACSTAESVENESTNALTAPDDQAAEAACAARIERFNELEIVHPNVVNSVRASNAADGPWSFRFLVEQMTPAGVTPSDFVLKFLRSWEKPQEVNGVTVEARPNIDSQVIQPWLDASGGGSTLDLAKAPFKLLAIVNRVDLHSRDCASAGEGRFVFGVTTQSGQPLSFTVIFEYHLPTVDGSTPHTWAKRWHALRNFDITRGDDQGGAYNTALQAITDAFAKRGAMPSAPNGNAISQVRSNEIALAGPWQLREFHLVANKSGRGFLIPATTAQSPTQDGLNDTAILHDFLADNKDAINDGSVVIPDTYTDTIRSVTKTVSILGPASNEDGIPWQSTDPTTKRNPDPIDATTLTNFSFLTCNGCHNLENVQIGGFYHVDPFASPKGNGPNAGSERLSPFLVGRVSPPVPSDLSRRATVMQGLLCQTSCPATPLVTGPEAARVE